MMKKFLRAGWLAMIAVLAFSLVAVGQETTGNIEVNIRDEADAVVPNATVTIESTGATQSFKRTVTSNDSGFVRVILVPPGEYIVTVAPILGFAERRAAANVSLGKTTPVNIVMGTSQEVSVDITSNETGLNINAPDGNVTLSAELVELIPKGINMSSVLKYSAATRPEPRSGQFQIDGASGAENTFVIDGQEVTDVLSGYLDRNTNMPLSILQETQVKTTGFEAEYGGATGGVINMVTKGGNNQWHGEAGAQFRSERFEPKPHMALIGYSTSTNPFNAYLNIPPPSYYPGRKSPESEFNPTFTLLGPLWKNHAWFAVAYAPQIWEREREIRYFNLRGPGNPGPLLPEQRELYTFYRRNEKVFARVDTSLFDKLSLYGTYKWSPEHNRGGIPGYTSEFAQSLTCSGALCGAAFTNQTGGRINSVNATAGGQFLITSKFIVSGRRSHYFMNNRLGTYGIGSVDTPRIVCGELRNSLFPNNPPPASTQFPAGFGCNVGSGNNAPATSLSLVDKNIRDQTDADAIYSFNAGGRHEFKGGFQENVIRNSVDDRSNDTIALYYGRVYQLTAFATRNLLAQLSGFNLQMHPNAVGVGALTIFQQKSESRGINKAYYIQDRWQAHRRLTFNLGIRVEEEVIPSTFPGFPDIKFDLGSKIGPRIGVSYDLRGDGKTRLSAFYGNFYDRFKLGLVRRTFGNAEIFHTLYFELFPGDTMASINRNLILGNGTLSEGTNCPTNTTTPIFGRVRCDNDLGFFGDGTPIDPNMKAFKQREVTFSVQHQLNRDYVFSARYSRKEVIDTIEDSSVPNASGGEIFVIGNPGQGLIKERFEELGLIAPRAQRQYDALELKLDRRFANNYFFSANYTYSRLYGNYGGLISSDEEGIRDDPYIQRYFDSPAAGFTAAGGPDNGLLATDRPHVLKAFGAYSLPWNKFGLWKSHSTDFQMFYTISSGSLITSFVAVNGNEQIILSKRGDQGRTPVFTQMDFALRHNIKFGRDGRYVLKFDADIINALNKGTLINKGLNTLSGQAGNLITRTNYNPTTLGLTAVPCTSGVACWAEAYRNFQANGAPQIIAEAQAGINRNPFWNVHHTWQARRTVRYGVHFTF